VNVVVEEKEYLNNHHRKISHQSHQHLTLRPVKRRKEVLVRVGVEVEAVEVGLTVILQSLPMAVITTWIEEVVNRIE